MAEPRRVAIFGDAKAVARQLAHRCDTLVIHPLPEWVLFRARL